MKNIKKFFAGLTAFSVVCSLTACSGGDSGSGAETSGDTTAATVETTSAVTVEINSETLSSEQEEQMSGAIDLLIEPELENKKIKWFSFYDSYHANNSGNTKSLSLELFEKKYGGEIEYVETTWQNRFNDMSTKIIGGEGIDFCPGEDIDAFPRGVTNGQFQSYDQYMNWDNPLWAEQKELNDMFLVKGNHYIMCTRSTANYVVYYNRATIENYGFDDPAELLEKGEWTWDAFKGMLLDYCDPDTEQYGLDGWFNELQLLLTCGVPPVELRDGKLANNLNDPRLEKAMNFMYELNTNGLVLDKNLFNWVEHPEFVGEGKELFYIGGLYMIGSAPEIWTETFGNQEDVMFVPLPKDPEADKYYLPARAEACMLLKGAQNPEGVLRFMECTMAANKDEGAQQLAVEKQKSDYGWSDEMIAMQDKVISMTRENPVIDIHNGVPTDLYDLLDSGEYGVRSAFAGIEWATVREELSDVCDIYIEEFNAQVDALE